MFCFSSDGARPLFKFRRKAIWLSTFGHKELDTRSNFAFLELFCQMFIGGALSILAIEDLSPNFSWFVLRLGQMVAL